MTKAFQNHWVFLILAAVLAVSSCTSGKSKEGGEGSAVAPPTRASSTLTIKGSDTMVILAQNWAQAFMDANPGKVLQVSGGGSGTGVAALINRHRRPRERKPRHQGKERKQLAKRRGVEAQEFRRRVGLPCVSMSRPPTRSSRSRFPSSRRSSVAKRRTGKTSAAKTSDRSLQPRKQLGHVRVLQRACAR